VPCNLQSANEPSPSAATPSGVGVSIGADAQAERGAPRLGHGLIALLEAFVISEGHTHERGFWGSQSGAVAATPGLQPSVALPHYFNFSSTRRCSFFRVRISLRSSRISAP
jgi:hypothetical protein